MDLGLTGRTFIVGGGSRGLGGATAAALHAEGAQVVLAARDPGAVEATAARLGTGAYACPADLAAPDAADRLVARALEETGRLDGALLNVGGPTPGAALATEDDTWRAAFESAFLGPIRLARTVAARLETGGRARKSGDDARHFKAAERCVHATRIRLGWQRQVTTDADIEEGRRRESGTLRS